MISRHTPALGLLLFAALGALYARRSSEKDAHNPPPLPPRVVTDIPAAPPAFPTLSAPSAPDMPSATQQRTSPREPDVKSRPRQEWQGMLIDRSVAPTCEDTAHCGLAQVCRGGRCLPCERDAECGRGEVCLLDHCVLEQLAACRSSNDCRGLPCVLSGYSSGARNNIEMRSYCADVESGHPTREEPQPPDDTRTVAPVAHTLMERVEQNLRDEP
jgi:hypothetical protein